MIIAGTTDYALPARADYDRTQEKVCAMLDCDEAIQDRSTYCGSCSQQVRRWKKACAKRAASTTQAWKVREARRQTIRLCELAAQRQEQLPCP